MKQILLATLLFNIALCQQAYDCAPGCMECTSADGCTACYNTILSPKKFIGLVSESFSQQAQKWDCYPKQPSDNCAVYAFFSSKKKHCLLFLHAWLYSWSEHELLYPEHNQRLPTWVKSQRDSDLWLLWQRISSWKLGILWPVLVSSYRSCLQLPMGRKEHILQRLEVFVLCKMQRRILNRLKRILRQQSSRAYWLLTDHRR